MGIRIYCNKKEVLDIRNAVFGFLHERIQDIIWEEKIELGDQIKELFERTDQNDYGPGGIYGVDIADFIKNKSDLLLFASLVKQAIETIDWTMPAAKVVVDHLWEFHAELLKYGEKLS